MAYSSPFGDPPCRYPTTGIAGRCACTATDEEIADRAAAPRMNAMIFRRLIVVPLSSLDHPIPAIPHDDRAGNVAGEVAGEKDCRADDVLGLSGTPQRRVIEEDLHQLRVIGARSRVERRLDQAGPDRVSAPAAFAELGRERAGKAEHPMLCGGVGER